MEVIHYYSSCTITGRVYNQNKPLQYLKLLSQQCLSSLDAIILSDYDLFQQFSAIRRSLTQKLQHNHGTHFGKDFASKADKLQQGAPCLDRLMLGRKKITEEDIWRTIEMQFCI
jgi:hypothetical protein